MALFRQEWGVLHSCFDLLSPGVFARRALPYGLFFLPPPQWGNPVVDRPGRNFLALREKFRIPGGPVIFQ